MSGCRVPVFSPEPDRNHDSVCCSLVFADRVTVQEALQALTLNVPAHCTPTPRPRNRSRSTPLTAHESRSSLTRSPLRTAREPSSRRRAPFRVGWGSRSRRNQAQQHDPRVVAARSRLIRSTATPPPHTDPFRTPSPELQERERHPAVRGGRSPASRTPRCFSAIISPEHRAKLVLAQRE